ncbi:MAG: hypothetical protein ACI9SC_000161 [Gammaproteobacteria bacterium]|jgi:uncharacterized protein YgfB (UPF0149 family)
MTDYDVLDALLVRVEAQAYAAECHGFICGQICVTGLADEDLWKEFLDLQSDDDALIQTCYTEIVQLVLECQAQMLSAEFGLELLLPDDDMSIAVRVEALGNWCHGFLNGYGVSEHENPAGVSEECTEVLEDFSKISRLGVDGDDPEDDHSLMELIEYTRMGAILIFEELEPAFDRPEVLH